MAGAVQNAQILTPEYLMKALKSKTTVAIANESGVDKKTVYNYCQRYGLQASPANGSFETKSVKLARLRREADLLETQLQKLVFQIDFLRIEIEDDDRVDMVKITKLAEKLRRK